MTTSHRAGDGATILVAPFMFGTAKEHAVVFEQRGVADGEVLVFLPILERGGQTVDTVLARTPARARSRKELSRRFVDVQMVY
jgi:hypothetical protein